MMKKSVLSFVFALSVAVSCVQPIVFKNNAGHDIVLSGFGDRADAELSPYDHLVIDHPVSKFSATITPLHPAGYNGDDIVQTTLIIENKTEDGLANFDQDIEIEFFINGIGQFGYKIVRTVSIQ